MNIRHAGVRQLSMSVGIHLVALLLALAIGSRTTHTSLAVERPHITLIAPSLPRRVTPPPAPRPLPPAVETPKARIQPKQFTPVVARRQPDQPPRIELTAPEPIQTAAIARPAIEVPAAALPPPPIVVGKLGDATPRNQEATTPAVIRTAGFVNSSISAPAAVQPPRVTGAGFSNSSMNAPGTTAQAPIASSGFSKAGTASPASAAVKIQNAPANTRPVEILSKPRPSYTEEARALRLEGEVVLEVLFTASAEARVVRVLHGLGHGLDEAAITSAARIEFRPALEAGKPVDQTATVRIRFELAY